MKINIIKTLDISILDEALDAYFCKTGGKEPKYIIMSNDTLKAIEQFTRKNIFLPQITETTIYRMYDKYPIAFYNKLNFGEIEIL